MTPKEKAEQLLHEYRMLFMDEGEDYGEEILVSVLSKQCALIAVDEIALKINGHHKDSELTTFIEYWQQVKKEIEKI
jgi:hypothetical protein